MSTSAHISSKLKKLIAAAILLPAAVLLTANWMVHLTPKWQRRLARAAPPSLYFELERLGHAFANYSDAVGLSGHDVKAPLPAPPGGTSHFFAGAPQRIPGGPAPTDITVIQKDHFTIGWSPSRRHPVWAAYRIPNTNELHNLARPGYFRLDPAATNSAAHRDYLNSGYDRGHMVPNHAIASRFGAAAQRETFMMSNVAPQRPWLNRGPWADVEHRASKHWPQRYGDVWMIVGAIAHTNASYRPRLDSGVEIPHSFYQIAVSHHKGKVRACAVIMPQQIRMRAQPRRYLATIREIEARSGLDFLHLLPEQVENALEEQLPTRLWPSGWRGLIEIAKRQMGIYHWME